MQNQVYLDEDNHIDRYQFVSVEGRRQWDVFLSYQQIFITC